MADLADDIMMPLIARIGVTFLVGLIIWAAIVTASSIVLLVGYSATGASQLLRVYENAAFIAGVVVIGLGILKFASDRLSLAE